MSKDKIYRQCILLTNGQRELLAKEAKLQCEGNISFLVRKIIDDHYSERKKK